MPHPTPPLPFPTRKTDAHKGDLGRVLLIGGSRGMAGSISLSAIAAMKTGSGLVSAAVPDRCLETVAGFHPGLMTVPAADTSSGEFDLAAATSNRVASAIANADAIGCGPGMQTGPGAVRLVETLLGHSNRPLVLDADAINVLSQHPFLANHPALPRDFRHLVLTPHPGEMARLTGVPANDRVGQIKASKELSRTFNVTVVLKGGPTVVAGSPDLIDNAVTWTNTTGNPGMATGGSGDILTGVITSLLGQGLSSWDAARLGVFVHGLAGDLAAADSGQAGLTCWEILQSLPKAIANC